MRTKHLLSFLWLFVIALALELLFWLGDLRERVGRNLVPVPYRFGQSGAVVNTKSTTITNLDAAQVVRAKAFANGAPLKEWIETLEVANGDSAASTLRFFRVPSWIRVSELLVDADDIGTTTTADIGLYRTAADGGAVVDADFFASAIVLNAGAIANSQVAHESAVVDLPNYGKRLWEQLGLTADPQIYYDVVATLVGAADGAGTVTLRLRGTEV